MHCIKTYTYCRWLVPALVGLASTVAGPALAQTTSAPLVCTGQLYQLTAGNSATSDTQIWEIGSDYRQGSAPLFTVPGVGLNGLAYNPQDGFLYAVNDYTAPSELRLYRLNASGVVSSALVTRLFGSAINDARNSGTFDAHGNLFIADGWVRPNQGLYVITGAASMTPEMRRAAIQADANPPTGYAAISLTGSSGGLNVGDLAYSATESTPTRAVLYGTRNALGGVVHLYRAVVDVSARPPTAQVSRINTTLPTGVTYGSAYLDANGSLIVSGNNNAFYRVDRATGLATELQPAQGTPMTNTDGTTCIAQPLVDVVKQASVPVAVLNGHTFDVPYTLTVGNTGAVPTPNVQISENLAATFAAGNPALSISSAPAVTAGTCTANSSFNGTSNFALLSGTDTLAPGTSCTVSFAVRVAYPDAGAVPTTAQLNTAHASVSSAANAGHSWPGGVLTPPANLLAQDASTNAAALPAMPQGDAPAPTPVVLPAAGPVTFAKAITAGANPLAGGVVSYGITLSNAGAAPVLYPAGTITDTLPANTMHAGGDDFTCAGTPCGNTNAVTVPANGSVALTLRVTVNAGVAPGTSITNTITPPTGTTCAPAPASCSVSTTVAAPPIPPADMSVAITGLPSVISPGSTVSGQIVCTATTGMGPALGASCTATAQDSNGGAVAVTVSNCTPPAPVASLAAGSAITCDVSYTAPGTAGGSDTAPTGVTLTATTGATNDGNTANNSAPSTATLIDALDDTAANQPAGATGLSFNVAGNDQMPAGSVFSLGTGSTCANPAVSTAGVATFDAPASGSCTVAYRVCAPAPNETACDTAVLTVTAGTGPQASNDSAVLTPGGPTTVNVLTNDPGRPDFAPGSIELANPPAGATLSADGKTLTVPGQGVWTVSGDTVVFTPEAGFTGAPTPIGYSFANAAGERSNVATITLTVAAAGAVTAVPTLSQWSLMLMALLLGGVGMRRWRGGGA